MYLDLRSVCYLADVLYNFYVNYFPLKISIKQNIFILQSLLYSIIFYKSVQMKSSDEKEKKTLSNMRYQISTNFFLLRNTLQIYLFRNANVKICATNYTNTLWQQITPSAISKVCKILCQNQFRCQASIYSTNPTSTNLIKFLQILAAWVSFGYLQRVEILFHIL